ncbi:MAG: hypothetical protein ACK5L5_09940 [Bacteroidales bacterium]
MKREKEILQETEEYVLANPDATVSSIPNDLLSEWAEAPDELALKIFAIVYHYSKYTKTSLEELTNNEPLLDIHYNNFYLIVKTENISRDIPSMASTSTFKLFDFTVYEKEIAESLESSKGHFEKYYTTND